jgi:hypothetical protein
VGRPTGDCLLRRSEFRIRPAAASMPVAVFGRPDPAWARLDCGIGGQRSHKAKGAQQQRDADCKHDPPTRTTRSRARQPAALLIFLTAATGAWGIAADFPVSHHASQSPNWAFGAETTDPATTIRHIIVAEPPDDKQLRTVIQSAPQARFGDGGALPSRR